MTATLENVTKKKDKPEPSAEQAAAEELVRRAREQGLPGRLGGARAWAPGAARPGPVSASVVTDAAWLLVFLLMV